jgi:hypothetical protein
MKKVVFLSALLGVLTWVGTATASDPIILPTGEEGCVSPAGDTCNYSSTRDGGYAAGGATWTLTIAIPANGDPRDTNADGRLRYVFGPSNAPEQGCGLWSAGAAVTTSAGASGSIAAGNPFPPESDPVIGTSNDCGTGKISGSNPNFTPVD